MCIYIQLTNVITAVVHWLWKFYIQKICTECTYGISGNYDSLIWAEKNKGPLIGVYIFVNTKGVLTEISSTGWNYRGRERK